MTDTGLLALDRIIPAYAGSTGRSRIGLGLMWDHPRIRGEHPAGPDRYNVRPGSSPHTRGARRRVRRLGAGRGIIPAYAGSTSSGSHFPFAVGDHPRIRGEHKTCSEYSIIVSGSSPHTRGAHLRQHGTGIDTGIIPAYAESTPTQKAHCPWQGDHPRIRGEHPDEPRPDADRLGSSPHTRGARAQGIALLLSIGDHPRIRGEHSPSLVHISPIPGSSPHTRGALRRPQSRPRSRRIIPAYAGSTRTASRAGWTSSDHPRIRGEHGGIGSPVKASIGSSPHTRGAPSGG